MHLKPLRIGAVAVVVTVISVLATACGSSDEPPASADAGRTVEVEMVDIAYRPDDITVARGDTVRFVFPNNGKVRHEAYIGTADEQAEHEKEMTEGGSGSAGHDAHGGGSDSDTKVTVEPGERGELTYRFEDAGTYEIGCHEPGHYAAGMKVTVQVT